jgi:4-hydroxybenzoate polyprenyltransferase
MSTAIKTLSHHAYTIWLFTASDLKTIVIPSTFFAVVCALSGRVMQPDNDLSNGAIALRVPLTVFWCWMNLLPFAIENQRQEESIKEDAENKPWRPMPSKRLMRSQAVTLMLLFYACAILLSSYLGGLGQCITLIGLGYWYNDLKGADASCIIRNFINACGYICFTSGALEVISGRSIASFDSKAFQWLMIIGTVVFTTIQSQDMPDQAGDSLRDRKTVPLVIGDKAARISIVIPLAIWSCVCPAFWRIHAGGCVVPVILAAITIGRFLSRRTAEADKVSFRIYNVWIVSIYLLPLFKRISQFR